MIDRAYTYARVTPADADVLAFLARHPQHWSQLHPPAVAWVARDAHGIAGVMTLRTQPELLADLILDDAVPRRPIVMVAGLWWRLENWLREIGAQAYQVTVPDSLPTYQRTLERHGFDLIGIERNAEGEPAGRRYLRRVAVSPVL